MRKMGARCTSPVGPLCGTPSEEFPLFRQEKRIIAWRHGEGFHQTGGYVDPTMGPALTTRGVEQAKALRTHPSLVSAAAGASRPLYASSHFLRTVQTMSHAAPGKHIVLAPECREMWCAPTRLEGLERWAGERGVSLDVEAYERILGEAWPNGAPREPSAFGAHIADVIKEDKGFPASGWRRAGRVVDWLGSCDADTIFLSAHGMFLLFLDLQADSNPLRTFETLICRRKLWANCMVREYRLLPIEAGGWKLVRAKQLPCCCCPMRLSKRAPMRDPGGLTDRANSL